MLPSAATAALPCPCNPPAPLPLPLVPCAVTDLIKLTNDPHVRQRLAAADSDGDGRISRRDILKVLKSEVSGVHSASASVSVAQLSMAPTAPPLAQQRCRHMPWGDMLAGRRQLGECSGACGCNAALLSALLAAR